MPPEVNATWQKAIATKRFIVLSGANELASSPSRSGSQTGACLSHLGRSLKDD